MLHVRGLVRRAGRRSLHAIEQQATAAAQSAPTCVRRVCLLDVDGRTVTVPLLHCAALLKLTEGMTREDALRAVEEVNQALRKPEDVSPRVSSSDAAAAAAASVLYVKDSCAETELELARRQRRFVSKLQGRLLAADAEAVEAALQQWLATPLAEMDDAAVATYRGMVEALTATDATAAVGLAINPALPSLNAGASTALAALVHLQAPTAVRAFLESFAQKDEMTLAAETSATHLAVRLRKELATDSSSSSTRKGSATHASPSATDTLSSSATVVAQQLLREASHFHMDPGVVFPADPAAVQQWAEQFLTAAMVPAEKAAVLHAQVLQRRLHPRRVSVDALSVWTLTDLERPWLAHALQPRRSGVDDEADVMWYSAALQLALKDARRNLVDNRFLHTYAAALERGDISALDASFPVFLEECGECHSTGTVERPAQLAFTLPRLPEEVPVLRALEDVAPQCSYWRTLLLNQPEKHVQVVTAPLGEVKVTVQLPRVHECVEAARSGAVALPPLPVLYEDAEVLVVDKPAGLATSRHGLSGTQVGAPTIDLISVLLATKFRDSATMSRVFRQGQVHRLDAETSGCLLIAKTDVAADSLRHQMGTSAAFAHNSKVYHALCLVLEPTLRNVKLHDDVIDAADPKVRTRYRVVKFFAQHRVAWVECRIQQGKKHQIRRHLASRGLPILGDVEHGGAACCQTMMSRVALHARSLSFLHPVTAEPVNVVAPLPADFRSALAQLH